MQINTNNADIITEIVFYLNILFKHIFEELTCPAFF